MGKLIKALLLITLAVSFKLAAAEFNTPYSHYSDGEEVGAVLADFARQQGMDAVISPAVKGSMSGRFVNENPMIFLQGMHAAFGVKWFRVGRALYFYHDSEWQQTMVRPVNLSAAALLRSLRDSGRLSPQLPVRLKGNLLTVSGPGSYVQEISALCASLDAVNEERRVMRVFKLKHAKADDTEINSMDRTVTVPGIASLLKQMVSGTAGPVGAQVKFLPSSVTKLRGTGLAADQEKPASDPMQFTAAQSSAAAPGIMADTRLNAVVVYDAEYRMPYYEKVIADLDVPAKLVELHAAIVDVDIDAARDLGVSWQGAHRFGNLTVGGGVGNSGNLNWGGIGSGAISNTNSGGIFSTVFNTANSSFLSHINFLESNQKARTLGRPSVLTMDNVEATLEDTTTRYVRVAGYQDVDLFKIDSGTVLRVTPHIIEGEPGMAPLISMVVSIQSNQDTPYETVQTANGEIPAIKQTTINTQALVREGQSLLLGGYYVEYQRSNDEGLPGLKNIPYAGKLFGSEGKAVLRRERIMIITPRILNLGELQSLPPDLDNRNFALSPTQTDYRKRPVRGLNESGCSSSRAVSGD